MTKSACFTGHRPEKMNITEDELRYNLKCCILDHIYEGYNTFYCGMARGMDIIAAETVIDLKKHYSLNLIAVIPFSNQSSGWSMDWKERYDNVLKNANDIVVLSKEYNKNCLWHRNKYMVDNSTLVIAYFDGQSGGTAQTIDYAKRCGVKIVNLSVNNYTTTQIKFQGFTDS